MNYETNDKIRRDIIERASRNVYGLHCGSFDGSIALPLINVGLLTHLTVSLNWRQITAIRFLDYNNLTRIDVKPEMLARRGNTLLVPIASVLFDGQDYLIKDLRGTMYMNVMNAMAVIQLYGKSDKVLVMQHCLDNIPIQYNKSPMLPMHDLMCKNIIRYGGS